MASKGWLTLIPFLLIPCALSLIQELDMPPDLMHCFESFERETNISATVGETIHNHCLRQFLWKTESIRWSGFNITQKNMDYINSLIDSFVRRRTKRQVNFYNMYPRTGFRTRLEYRRITNVERRAFHAAVNTMKRNGQYDTFANLHSGIVVTSAHGGPNFFGWHRIYIALFEEALRRIRPRVALPYWDSSLDFDLPNPVDSNIWSEEFLGNGDGVVTTGPFANWQTPVGPLTRNIGGGSRLISKQVIRTILTRCFTRDISEPAAEPQFNLELAHGGPHVWVGGQMSGLNTAAHDPVFFLHHAFIDYLWERFRRRQARFCRVNPETDYPAAMDQHAFDRLMDGFQQFRAIDGYQSFWTRYWYSYERSPWCSFLRRSCATPYLTCDVRRQRCVAVPRMTMAGTGAAAEGRFGVGPSTAMASANARAAMVSRGQAQERLLNIGPRFRAPPTDNRASSAIQAAIFGFQRPADVIQVGLLGASRTANNDFGPIFRAPPSDGRTSDQVFSGFNENIQTQIQTKAKQSTDLTGQGSFANMLPQAEVNTVQNIDLAGLAHSENILSQTQESDNQNISLTGLDHSGTVQFTNNLCACDVLLPPVQNTFFLNGQSETDMWAYIPVKVIHRRTQHDRFASFPVHNGNPSATEDVTSTTAYSNLKTQGFYSSAHTNEHCKTHVSGARQIIVTADGMNYAGTFSEYALIDSRLPMASAMTYIGIKTPDKGMTEVIVSAHDNCGRMCKPHCWVSASKQPSYKPCTGVLRISSDSPKQYGRTFGDAVESVWQWDAGRLKEENIRLVFYCTYDSRPWKNCNTTQNQ